jgi:hypothetical protein
MFRKSSSKSIYMSKPMQIIKIMASMDGRRNYSSSELLKTKASDSIFNEKNKSDDLSPKLTIFKERNSKI